MKQPHLEYHHQINMQFDLDSARRDWGRQISEEGAIVKACPKARAYLKAFAKDKVSSYRSGTYDSKKSKRLVAERKVTAVEDKKELPFNKANFLRKHPVKAHHEMSSLPLVFRVEEPKDMKELGIQDTNPDGSPVAISVDLLMFLRAQEAYDYCADLLEPALERGNPFRSEDILETEKILNILLMDSGVFPEGADVSAQARVALMSVALKRSREICEEKLRGVFKPTDTGFLPSGVDDVKKSNRNKALALIGLPPATGIIGGATLTRLQETLALLGPQDEKLTKFFDLYPIPKKDRDLLIPVIRSEHRLLNSAISHNKYADKVNESRQEGKGMAGKAKEALADLNNLQTYNERVRALPAGAEKAAAPAVAAMAAADAVLDSQFESLASVLSRILVSGATDEFLSKHYVLRTKLIEAITNHVISEGFITESEVAVIVDNELRESKGMDADTQKIVKNAVKLMTEAANADPLAKKISEPIIKASRKDSKEAKAMAQAAQSAGSKAVLAVLSFAERRKQGSSPDLAFIAVNSALVTAKSILAYKLDESKAISGDVDNGVLKQKIEDELKKTMPGDFKKDIVANCANMVVQVALQDRAIKNALQARSASANQAHDASKAKEILINAAAIGASVCGVLQATIPGHAEAIANKCSQYYIQHQALPTIQFLNEQIISDQKDQKDHKAASLSNSKLVSLISDTAQTALNIVEGLKESNAQRQVAIDKVTNVLRQAGYPQGLSQKIANAINKLPAKDAKSIGETVSKIIESTNKQMEHVYRNFAITEQKQGEKITETGEAVRDAIIQHYRMHGSMVKSQFSELVKQAYRSKGKEATDQDVKSVLRILEEKVEHSVQPLPSDFQVIMPFEKSLQSRSIIETAVDVYSALPANSVEAGVKAVAKKNLSEDQAKAIAQAAKKEIADGHSSASAAFAAIRVLPKGNDFTAAAVAAIATSEVSGDIQYSIIRITCRQAMSPLTEATASAIGSAIVAADSKGELPAILLSTISTKVVENYLNGQNNFDFNGMIDSEATQIYRTVGRLYKLCDGRAGLRRLGFARQIVNHPRSEILTRIRDKIVDYYCKHGQINNHIVTKIRNMVIAENNKDLVENDENFIPQIGPVQYDFDEPIQGLEGPFIKPWIPDISPEQKAKLSRAAWVAYASTAGLKAIKEVPKSKVPNLSDVAAAVTVAGIADGLIPEDAIEIAKRISSYYAKHENLDDIDITAIAKQIPEINLTESQRNKLLNAAQVAASIPPSADAVSAGTSVAAKVFSASRFPAHAMAMAAVIAKAHEGSAKAHKDNDAAIGTAAAYAESVAEKMISNPLPVGAALAVVVSSLYRTINAGNQRDIKTLDKNVSNIMLGQFGAEGKALTNGIGAAVVANLRHITEIIGRDRISGEVKAWDGRGVRTAREEVASISAEVYLAARKIGLDEGQANHSVRSFVDLVIENHRNQTNQKFSKEGFKEKLEAGIDLTENQIETLLTAANTAFLIDKGLSAAAEAKAEFKEAADIALEAIIQQANAAAEASESKLDSSVVKTAFHKAIASQVNPANIGALVAAALPAKPEVSQALAAVAGHFAAHEQAEAVRKEAMERLESSDEAKEDKVGTRAKRIQMQSDVAANYVRAEAIIGAVGLAAIGDARELPPGANERRAAELASEEEYQKKKRAFQNALLGMQASEGPPPADSVGISSAMKKYGLDISTQLDAKNAGDWMVKIASSDPMQEAKPMEDIEELKPFVERLKACDGFVTAETLRMAIDRFNEKNKSVFGKDPIPKEAITVRKDGSIKVSLEKLSKAQVAELVEMWTEESEFARDKTQNLSKAKSESPKSASP